MRASAFPTGFLLVATFLAACLQDETPIGPADDVGKIAYYLLDEFPVDVDHDHSKADLHNVTLNLHHMGYSSCSAAGTVDSSVGGFTDIAFHKQLAFVGNGHGFCVLDVADPAQPMFIGQYEGEYAADLEVSEDGRFVFLLTQRNGAPGPLLRGDTEPRANVPRGAIVVDVSDPAHPAFESYYPVPTNGVHTATAYKMGTRQLLFVQTYDWFPPSGVDAPVPTQNLPITQRVEVLELGPLGDVMVLQRIATWNLDRPVEDPLAYWFPHDSFVQFHPIDRKTYLYVAYWDAGLVILDVSDPASPQFVSQYNDKAPSLYNNYHDVKAFPELINGRHITVTGPELPTATEAGHVRVFDTTDPSSPVQLGTWRLPGNPGTPGGFLFSPHVFTLHEGRIFIGHNHGGVWVIDVSNETLLHQPASAGFYFPTPKDGSRSSVWGAYWYEGYVYATEGSSGVHVLHYAGDAMPMDDMMDMPGHQH